MRRVGDDHPPEASNLHANVELVSGSHDQEFVAAEPANQFGLRESRL